MAWYWYVIILQFWLLCMFALLVAGMHRSHEKWLGHHGRIVGDYLDAVRKADALMAALKAHYPDAWMTYQRTTR